MNDLSPEQHDDLFDIFRDTQGLQRRVLRIISRRSASKEAIAELRGQAKGILDRAITLGDSE